MVLDFSSRNAYNSDWEMDTRVIKSIVVFFVFFC